LIRLLVATTLPYALYTVMTWQRGRARLLWRY